MSKCHPIRTRLHQQFFCTASYFSPRSQVYIDTDVAVKTHVTNTFRGWFSALRQIRRVRRSLPRHALVTLVRALVVSKVAVLVGIPGYLQKRLQSVLNAAALLIYSAKKYDHITPLLRELHWLRVPERIQFRLCVLTYRCLTGTAPQYLADTLSLSTNVAARCRLRSADSRTLQLPSTRRTTLGDRAFSVSQRRAPGTVCRPRFEIRTHC